MGVISISQIKLKELNSDSDMYDGTFFKEKAMWSESYSEKVALTNIDILKSIESEYGGNILKINRGNTIYALNRIEIKNNHNYKVKIRAKTSNVGLISAGFMFYDHNNEIISNKSINAVMTSNNGKVVTIVNGHASSVITENNNAVKGNSPHFIVLENENLNTEWTEYETIVKFDLDNNIIKSVKPVISTGFYDDSYALVDCYLFSDITDIRSELNNIFADNAISPIEKNMLSTEWARIQSEYSSTILSADKYKVDTTEYIAKYNVLKAKMELVLDNMDIAYNDNCQEVYDAITAYYQALDNIKLKIENSLDVNIAKKVDGNVNSVFNALTNNGKIQGLFLQDGKLYVNGEYIKANTITSDHITANGITANKIKTGILQAMSGGSYLNLDDGSMLLGTLGDSNFLQWTGTALNIRATSLNIGSSSVATQNFVTETATSIATTVADTAANNAVSNMSQTDVFNKLTNNIQDQGIYLENGKLYINGQFIQAGQINANLITTGELNAKLVNVTNLNASNITAGEMSADRITSGVLDATRVNVANLNANNITAGTIDANKIKVTNLDATEIKTGTLNASLVNVTNLNASNITSGTINADYVRVINLDADNITSGTISGNRIQGGIIEGAQLKTPGDTINGGIWIKDAGMQVGTTSIFYSDAFRIEAGTKNIVLSAAEFHVIASKTSIGGTLNCTKLTIGGTEITPSGITAVFG